MKKNKNRSLWIWMLRSVKYLLLLFIGWNLISQSSASDQLEGSFDPSERRIQFCEKRIIAGIQAYCRNFPPVMSKRWINTRKWVNYEEDLDKRSGPRNIVEECCRQTCPIRTFMRFCPPFATKITTATRATKTTLTTTTTTTTTTEPPKQEESLSELLPLLLKILTLGLPKKKPEDKQTVYVVAQTKNGNWNKNVRAPKFGVSSFVKNPRPDDSPLIKSVMDSPFQIFGGFPFG